LTPGATLIDVGINRIAVPVGVRLVGDVDFDAARHVARAITPVPGGPGRRYLPLRNTLLAASRRRSLPDRGVPQAEHKFRKRMPLFRKKCVRDQ
jgi:methylenetetrahydrofolate dehydrogenase (NADP+)/methenyltetrahydrofolate cyclohydrolase